MTKSDISYASVPSVAPNAYSSTSQPYVDGFVVGSHAVTVIVDEHDTRPQQQAGAAGPYAPDRQVDIFSGSRHPVQLSVCPQCGKSHVRTLTRTYPSAVTWVGVVATAIVFFPICWIPLVVDSMKQTDHYCQECGRKVGSIKAMEGCFVKERM